jgi:quercetin dioxygenase-like cupin family protein
VQPVPYREDICPSATRDWPQTGDECDAAFAFETNSLPGQFVPVHIHPTQDQFILVQEGVLDLKLDGVWVQAKAGDLVRMPRRIPHGYFNKSDKPARALFWVSPAGKLEALFEKADELGDPVEVVNTVRAA